MGAQLGNEVGDRAVGRHLHEIGWRVAEEVVAYIDAERKRAYWAGMTGEPLESVLGNINPREWRTPQRGLMEIG